MFSVVQMPVPYEPRYHRHHQPPFFLHSLLSSFSFSFFQKKFSSFLLTSESIARRAYTMPFGHDWLSFIQRRPSRNQWQSSATPSRRLLLFSASSERIEQQPRSYQQSRPISPVLCTIVFSLSSMCSHFLVFPCFQTGISAFGCDIEK